MPDDFYLIDHEITVARLKKLLSLLKDDDVLIPNRVRNLTIVRNDKYFGFIDLLKNDTHVEIN